MADDVLLNKAATIERCVARARDEFNADPQTFATNFTRQDAAILNIQRACDVFALLATAHWLEPELAESMKHMVGFRNIAVHEYQTLQLPITVNIIQSHLGEFLAFSRQMLLKDTHPH